MGNFAHGYATNEQEAALSGQLLDMCRAVATNPDVAVMALAEAMARLIINAADDEPGALAKADAAAEAVKDQILRMAGGNDEVADAWA
jgi:hypothetical protein